MPYSQATIMSILKKTDSQINLPLLIYYFILYKLIKYTVSHIYVLKAGQWLTRD